MPNPSWTPLKMYPSQISFYHELICFKAFNTVSKPTEERVKFMTTLFISVLLPPLLTIKKLCMHLVVPKMSSVQQESAGIRERSGKVQNCVHRLCSLACSAAAVEAGAVAARQKVYPHHQQHLWSSEYLDNILKSRDIILPTKVHLVKAMIFPVVMYGCESWTIKTAERQRIDAFELWCWRRLLRGPWTAKRSNQSILKEVSPEYSLEGLMLKLKLWPSNAKNWLIRKDPDAGKDWRQEEKGVTEDEMVGWHHRVNGHEFE